MRPVVVVAATAARRHALVKAIGDADPSLEVWPAEPTHLTRAEADALLLVAGADLAPAAAAAVGPSARMLVLDDAPGAIGRLRPIPAAAWGVIPARATMPEILAASAAVDAGFIVTVPPGRVSARPRLDGQTGAAGSEEAVRDEPLTPREHDVLDLLVQGLSNRRMGAVLGISEHTVKFHVASIYGKLGARGRAQLVRRALGRGLVTL